MKTEISIEPTRQRYFSLIDRYIKGTLNYTVFIQRLSTHWAADREDTWRIAWHSSRAQRCQEQEVLANGKRPRSQPSDPRRLCRMLDRLNNPHDRPQSEELFRDALKELVGAYHNPEKTSGEAQYVAYPPRIPVVERPLPGGKRHQYPCSVADIRRQMALVPEYDLVGLRAIGLCPANREHAYTYATYYRRCSEVGAPGIVIRSATDGFQFKLHWRYDPGFIEHRFRVEIGYGMQIDRFGNRAICRWSEENVRRYMSEHVLLHEIGHHVQYQQRSRAQYTRGLPSRDKEQFAEDYAIRFQRERKEQS